MYKGTHYGVAVTEFNSELDGVRSDTSEKKDPSGPGFHSKDHGLATVKMMRTNFSA